jgi:tripartite-type tricarboxylate transporter receptor subunit TctC
LTQLPRDIAAVGFGFEQLLAIAVSPKLGIKTLQELIDLARKKPGEISYAVTGVGIPTRCSIGPNGSSACARRFPR